MSDQSQFDFSFQQPARRIWSVRDLVGAVRTHIEREYADVWVEGEITNFRPAASGHLYFTLRDGETQLRIVMFRMQARLLRFKPEEGLRIIARGRITIYEGRGELQLSAEYLEPMGAGALQVAFEQLKAKLAAEGLFERDRKKPLPALARRIGIVTSARGAAIQDILNILRRRHEGVNVTIYPAQVQGEAAAAEVGAGVKYFNRAANVDVIIVARGGGSVEDLAAFNDEGLARAIAASNIPVISAVGHETDFTICDFVADLRAPTPSAAAELVIRSKSDLEEQVGNLQYRLGRSMRYIIMHKQQMLSEVGYHAAFARMNEAITRRQQRVDDLVYRLARAHADRLRAYRQRLDTASARVLHHDLRLRFSSLRQEVDARTGRMTASMRSLLFRSRSHLQQASTQLEGLSPVAILDRGYALVFDAEGKLVKNATQLSTGQEVSVRLAKGSFGAEVKRTGES